MSVNSDIKEAARKEIIRRKVMAEMERRKAQGQAGDSTVHGIAPLKVTPDTQPPVLAPSMPVSSTDVAINPVQPGFDQPSIGAWDKPWTKDLASGLRDFGYGAASGYATMGSAGDPTYVHPSGVETGPEHTENPFLGFLPTTPYDIGEFVGLAGPISGIAKGVGAVGKKAIPKVAQWAMQHSPTARFLGQRLSESVTGGTFSTAHQAATKGHVDPKEVAASAVLFPALGTGGKLLAKTGGAVKRGIKAKPLSRLITGGEEVPVVSEVAQQTRNGGVGMKERVWDFIAWVREDPIRLVEIGLGLVVLYYTVPIVLRMIGV